MRIKEDSKRISCWVWGVALVGLLSPVLLAGCAGQDAIKGIEGGEAIGSSTPEAVRDQTLPAESHTSYSRVQLFSSLDEMADDSDEVATVVVDSQEEVYDIDETTPFVLTRVTVQEGYKGSLHGGDEIIVRQTGFVEESLLENGSSYLLYLVPSGLDGELAGHYYINGVTAGIYQVEAPTARSRSQQPGLQRVDVESGDDLPNAVSMDEVVQSL